MRLGGVGLAVAAATAVDQRGEADALTVTHVDVPLARWPASAKPMTLGLLADMHCENDHAVERTARAAQMLRAESPDVVMLAGDFNSAWPSIWTPKAALALTPIADAPGGVFCVLGNHDWSGGGQDITPQIMGQLGFTFLRNQAAPVKTIPGLWVVGLDDLYYGRADIESAMQGVPSDACKLLLVHEPDFADQSPPGFALQLSGHSHGGQICLPGLPPLHVPEYSTHYPEGLRQGPHHPVYTTRGIGTTGPPVRLFCPPEITVLHLHSL
jgi:predicted MPP superfamily phosphohydrolase